MSQFFLGIDIGGTKSHALIADEQGTAISLAHGGAGNYEVVGWEGLRAVLHEIITRALDAAGIAKDRISAAGFGIAGYDWPSERPPHVQAIESLALPGPYALENDTIIGLVAGAPAGWGVGVVAGTGCNCWGRDPHGREGRVTGEGAWFAEYGGGGDLVFRAVQSVSLAWSKRGPETRLSEALVAKTGAESVEELLEGLILGRYSLGAEAAPLVFEVAAGGDEVALEIIRWAGRELASMAIGVIRQLNFESLSFDIVQIGSLFNGSPLLGETMLATVQQEAPGARATRLNAPPVVGGVLLAMELAGLQGALRRERLIKTTRGLLGN